MRQNKKNFIGEAIPYQNELVNLAQKVLEKINEERPLKISETLVKENGNYNGWNYFKSEDIFKHLFISEKQKDFSGVYIFYENDVPVYVGITNTIIRRLRQHLFGTKNNQASFVYLMAKSKHELEIGTRHVGKRKDFPFKDYRTQIQANMKDDWKFIVHPQKGGYELSFIEMVLAAELQTKWNTFKPH